MDYRTGDKFLIRKINKALIMKIIREKGPVSRADIARILGLNPATVSGNIKLLIRDGLIKELGTGTSSGGRKPVLLGLNETAFNCIGVDVQKDKVVTAVVTLDGRIKSRSERLFEEPICQKSIVTTIVEAIHDVKQNSGIKNDCFFGIGVGMHGIVNHENGISVYAPAFSWRNINMKDIIEDAFDLPVAMDNDARVMTLGEKWFGVAKGADNFVFIHAGTGIGSGVIIGGELYRGRGGAAGEVGHIRVVENGVKCVCGKFGCLDTVATEKSLIKSITSGIQLGYNTFITELVDDLSKINIEIIYKAAKKGDELAIKSLEQVGRYLGIAIADIINILNPEMVVIGGGDDPGERLLFSIND